MKKILLVSTVSRQFYLFEQGNIEVLNSLGYEVHAAANYNDASERLDTINIVRHHFEIQRSPFSFKNIRAYKQLREILKSEKFDAVHCHTPMGGVLARLAAKADGISPIIYTAHGFHFYKGAPLINWLIYYSIEKLLSKYTDVLITINEEDYKMAQSFKAKKVVCVPGIGVDTSKFDKMSIDKKKKREELGILSDAIVLLSIGEMINRKNHKTVLKAISKLNCEKIVYLICGKGELEDYLKALVKKLNIKSKVKFLGFRNDIPEICLISDVFAFPSYQEGLPVALMEAMSAGLPVVCSAIRGNMDLIEHGRGGYLLKPNDVNGFATSIQKLIHDYDLRKKMGDQNIAQIKKFDISIVKKDMEDIY